MSDLYISWTEYHQKIETLATKIYHSQWQFNQIVCLARGGLRVGDIISRIFDQPMAILSTSSYYGAGGKVRGEIKLAEHLTMTTETLGSQVLLVDDLVDSGISLQESIGWLKSRYPHIKEIKTAVIWYKSCSVMAPDYYIDYLSDNPWIHQPFECYENFNLAELESRG
ncbi:MAG TPA: phosphoribosyltransferase [Planktothrix sp. UBA8407]|jgi:Predicted phosphoribosyltransferases|nr:phosphoribosyltransferase [Planktothrix sp. UBA8402]HAO13260.1 phosphoribosyltransferase [Planktothrix sp. UBA8407]HBK23462.1 phosphoribosyltransferase [Planktothrix sp. UBA10369]